MRRVRSGIGPIDDHLGGFVAGRSHVISGAAGTGKSLAALEFLQAGLLAGERGLLLTQEDPADVLAQTAFLGLDFDGALRDDQLVLLQFRSDFVHRFSRTHSCAPVLQELRDLIGAPAPHRIAVDSIAPILDNAATSGRSIEEFLRFLTGDGASVLLTCAGDLAAIPDWRAEPCGRGAAMILHFALDRSCRRSIEVRKVRFNAGSTAPMLFRIEPGTGIIGTAPAPIRQREAAAEGSQRLLLIDLSACLPPELLQALRARAEVTSRHGVVEAFSDLARSTPAAIMVSVRRDTVREALTLVRELRVSGNVAPIVLVTNFVLRSDDRARALRAGADDFLSGDIHPDEFLLRLERVLSGARSVAMPVDRTSAPTQPSDAGGYRPLDAADFRAAVQSHLQNDRCPFFTIVTFNPLDGDVRRLAELAIGRMRIEGGDLAGVGGDRVAVFLHSARRKDVNAFIERLQSEWIGCGHVDLRVEVGSYPAEEPQVLRLLETQRV